MAERKWTEPQKDAINAQGGSILVSAAAGSGKTAVLVERAIRLICDESNPVSAERLLVVTFSNAAATEMRQRIGIRLAEMIAQQPENMFLQRQLALLQGAQISTVHAFCLELIRQNFQHLEISPDFVLADEQEMALMERDCVRLVVENFYEADETGDFYQLVELLTNGRDDRNLIETILRIYAFSRSHPFYKEWLDSKAAMYNPQLSVESTVWGQTILTYVQTSLKYCRDVLLEMMEIIQQDPLLTKGYGAAFSSDLLQVESCLNLLQGGDWDSAVEHLSRFEFIRLGAVRGNDEQKIRVKSARDHIKKIVQDIAGKYLNITAVEFQEDISALSPQIKLLFELVKAFDAALWEAKGEKKRLDFSDLEHLALQLLVTKQGDQYVRTERAKEIAGRFDTVMVDEYQDTNEVQDLIFSSVSNNQNNLFMVGDVKQSIYSFRQAMPEIFLQKKQIYFPYNKTGQFPAKILLDTNFRSRKNVTDAVNFLFSMLMSVEIGGMNYDEEESLKCGAAYPINEDMQPEFLLLENSGANQTPLEAEAASVAEKIAGMLQSGYPITDGEETRSAQPKDFCILLRSPRGKAQIYQEALTSHAIPCWTETTKGYLQAKEVGAITSLLKALDNPMLDIELVAALMSPLFSFTGDDISEIRLQKRNDSFFYALKESAQEGNKKAKTFLELFQQLRTKAAILPADRLLLEIYDKTHAIDVVQAMSMGDLRVSNLRLLVEYAADYHRIGYKRLSGFVSFLNRMEERGGDFAPAGNSGGKDAANAVRILSIHKSKGLEYPVVFLCDTFRQFNKMDLRATSLLHSQYGFACVRRDEGKRQQYTTVPMQAIRLESERALLSEELRVLYVALTRAKEKLIISGYSKNKVEKRLSNLQTTLQKGKLPTYNVRAATCYADWILMALSHHKSGEILREKADNISETVIDDNNPWRITIKPPTEKNQDVPSQEIHHHAKPDPDLLAYLRSTANFDYPYMNQTKIPTKLAVSTVAKEKADVSYRFSAKPSFLAYSGLSGAQRGNALHKFMQFANYENARQNLTSEIQRMKNQGFLSSVEADSLSLKKIEKFFTGQLAERIFVSSRVLRELKFMAECGKDVLGEQIEEMDEEARVVLQGVADCVFYEDDGAVIVDYKTDVVKNEDELRQRYQMQITLYKGILQQSLDVPIKQCLLYSFHLGRHVLIV